MNELPEPRETVEIASADGRTIVAARWGVPGGSPVVAQHGTPMSRLDPPGPAALLDELNVDLVTFDRAGYGRSTPLPGRSVAAAAADTLAVADACGLERFSVYGVSGGGPHALACAALIGDRLVRTACVVGFAPFDGLDLDFFAGFNELSRAEFEIATQGRAALEAYVHEFVTLTQTTGSAVMDEWSDELPEPDRVAYYGTPESRAFLERALVEALSVSGDGWIDDDVAFVTPWGFELEAIDSPVSIWSGALDRLVPPDHGRYLADRIPDAELHVVPDRGHALDDRPILTWLVDW